MQVTSGHFHHRVGSQFFLKFFSPILFLLKKGPLGGSRGREYACRTPLVGCTVKTNTTDKQTVDSDYSKTIHQEVEEDHKTKETRDQGVEKHSCQIELRGTHLNLVYYNGKQVLREYRMVHFTTDLHVRNEDELAD